MENLFVKSKSKFSALGDDPLAWISKDLRSNAQVEIRKKRNLKLDDLALENRVDKDFLLDNDFNLPKKNKNSKNIVEEKPKIEEENLKKSKETVNKLSKTNSMKVIGSNFNPYRFKAVMTVNQGDELKLTLSGLLNDNASDISIDASEIESIDSAILQLIVAFALELSARNSKLLWLNVPRELIVFVKTLGLEKILNLERISV